LDLTVLDSLTPDQVRTLLPAFLAGHIEPADVAARNLARIGARVAQWSDEACLALAPALKHLGEEHRVYDPLPEVREVGRDWMRDLAPEYEVAGLDAVVEARARGPVVFISNHLAYVDSSAIDAVLVWEGHRDIADAIVSLAGPKVYDDAFRRFATSCLSTLPVPQSTSLAHTAPLPPRELARRARQSVDAAEASLRSGRHLLIFAEGSRSRSGRLQPFLAGVHRYLGLDGTIVVPIALVGTRGIMPLGRTQLVPGRLSIRFGEPLVVEEHGGGKNVLDTVHERLTQLLPREFRPE
jgi:1-acyl-sn-glycerol-3-phosphate acyltransferase